MKPTNKQEQELNTLALMLFGAYRRLFRPLYPWVFVRTLPKEQKVGLIYTPDVQNKTMHEGIVLVTWDPFTVPGKTLERKSLLHPGQHVLYPYWAGQPIDGFRPDLYRVVKESDWTIAKDGGIIATVSTGENIREQLAVFLRERQITGIGTDRYNPDDIAEMLIDRFLLVDKHQKSTTLSGV